MANIKMEKIKNIVFDLGGVIIDLDQARCQAAFRTLGMERIAQIIDPCYPAEMIGKLEKGDISFRQACDQMRAIDAVPEITDEQIAWAYGEFLEEISIEKLRMIEKLRDQGVHTYVLSNNNPTSMQVIRRMFTADGHTMDDYFDHIYLSYELRELKPSEAIFRKMIAQSGIVPAQTLFIDDGAHNIAMAQKLGFGVYMPGPHEDFSHLFDDLGA